MLLSPVPKVSNLTTLNDFRPISCCNMVYKSISSITNRMKAMIVSLVSPYHSAFIHGRKITNNILLSHELLRNYQRDNGRPRCAAKMVMLRISLLDQNVL